MAVSKAQQKAVHKYVKANYDRQELTMPKGKKDKIKAHADSKGESVNAFINRAIDEAIEGEHMPADGLPLDYDAINKHIEKTGETVPTFVNRAIKDQIERDNTLFKMGLLRGK